MVLRNNVLKAIDIPRHRSAIAAAMGLGEQTVRQYIIKNDPKLTQFSALQTIKKIIGVAKDTDLLEEEQVPAPVQE